MFAVDNARSRSYRNDPILTDTVFAMARPNEVMSKKIGATNAVAFLGKKHTYLLVEGGDKLSQIARDFSGDSIRLEPRSGQLYLKGKTVWGNLLLSCEVSRDAAQAATDEAKLLAYGFTRNGKSRTYNLSVAVKGTVWPAAKLGKGTPEFTKTREICFYRAPDAIRPPDFQSLITIPLAVVADVALTPVYIAGFVVLVLSN